MADKPKHDERKDDLPKREAEKENEKAAEGERYEKTPNPGHPV
ncbi:hypothetical protein [Azospirillum sp. ST 5-10]